MIKHEKGSEHNKWKRLSEATCAASCLERFEEEPALLLQ